MKDLLRIYVLWHPESAFGQAAANAIAKHFDGLGMERDGVAYRVPVRFRSEGWDPSSRSRAPAEIPWEDAEHTLIWDALTEHEINEQMQQVPRMQDKIKALTQKGPKLLEALEQRVQGRLWNSQSIVE